MTDCNTKKKSRSVVLSSVLHSKKGNLAMSPINVCICESIYELQIQFPVVVVAVLASA